MTDAFAPARLGPVSLRNRVVKAATFEGRTPHGRVTPELIEFHRRIAAGGVAMTTVAYLAVAPEGRPQRECLVVGEDTAAGLRDLAEAVHATGAAVSAQLGHAGPVANGRSNGVRAVAASGLPSPLSMQWVASATERDLSRVLGGYAGASRHLAAAGFDAVELHFGHSYLVSSFLAAGLNRRRDRWGGSLENRMRLAREVARVVHGEVGGSLAVTAKVSLGDGFQGGVTLDEAIPLVRMLAEDATVDAVELTGGSSLMNPMYLFRGGVPRREFAAQMPWPVRAGMRLGGGSFLKDYEYAEGYFRDRALAVRTATGLPLIFLGGVSDRATIEQAMADGFDFVAMGRALLREPDLVNRYAARTAERSACIHCNRCMPTIYEPGGTHCPEIA